MVEVVGGGLGEDERVGRAAVVEGGGGAEGPFHVLGDGEGEGIVKRVLQGDGDREACQLAVGFVALDEDYQWFGRSQVVADLADVRDLFEGQPRNANIGTLQYVIALQGLVVVATERWVESLKELLVIGQHAFDAVCLAVEQLSREAVLDLPRPQ